MNSNILSIFSTRWFKALVVLLCLGGYGIWYVQNDRAIRREAWDGLITEQWESLPFWVSGNSISISNDRKYRRRIRHYWRVKRDDGPEVEVKVTRSLYNSGGPGTRVKKVFSERYPRVVR